MRPKRMYAPSNAHTHESDTTPSIYPPEFSQGSIPEKKKLNTANLIASQQDIDLTPVKDCIIHTLIPHKARGTQGPNSLAVFWTPETSGGKNNNL